MTFRSLLASMIVACASVEPDPPAESDGLASKGDSARGDGTLSDSGGVDTGRPDDTFPSDTDPPSRLSGTLSMPSGVVVGPAAAQVRYCRPTGCLVSQQGDDGTWRFGPLPPGIGAIEVLDVAGGASWATWAVPYRLGSGREVVFDLTAWLAARPVALAEARDEVSLDAALILQIASDDFVSNDRWEAPAGAVGATRVDPELLPPLQGLRGTVLAAWLLEPFDHVAVRVGATALVEAGHEGATAGDELWVSLYDQGRWVRVGALVTDARRSGWLRSDGVLTRLGTLVVVRP